MKLLRTLVSSLSILVVTASQMAAGAKEDKGPSALVVPVSKPVQREVTDYVDYTGRISAKESVTIMPRVTGFLVKMPFKEGAEVKKGDVLFEIDPRPYQAKFKAAEAAVAQNEASVEYAKLTNESFKGIKKLNKDAVTQRELDQYAALERQARASLDFAVANLLSAKLDLEWTVVRTPIDGRVSRYFMTVGNLVNQDVTALTTVVSMDPIHVFFDMDEATVLRSRRDINAGRKEAPKEVMIGLPGEDGFPHRATIDFMDNQFNPKGGLSMRGVFANAKPKGGVHLLSPGMFVRVRLPIGQPQPALLVTDRAIASEKGQRRVYVVDADGKVEVRPVTVGALQADGLRVIAGGVTKDDWVLVGGLMQVQPGMKVRPKQVTMPILVHRRQVIWRKAKGTCRRKSMLCLPTGATCSSGLAPSR